MGKSKIEAGSWEREQFTQIRWTQQAFSEKDGEYHAAEDWETKGFVINWNKHWTKDTYKHLAWQWQGLILMIGEFSLCNECRWKCDTYLLL